MIPRFRRHGVASLHFAIGRVRSVAFSPDGRTLASASVAAMARYGLAAPSPERFSIRPGPGIRTQTALQCNNPLHGLQRSLQHTASTTHNDYAAQSSGMSKRKANGIAILHNSLACVRKFLSANFLSAKREGVSEVFKLKVKR